MAWTAPKNATATATAMAKTTIRLMLVSKFGYMNSTKKALPR